MVEGHLMWSENYPRAYLFIAGCQSQLGVMISSSDLIFLVVELSVSLKVSSDLSAY